LPLDAGIVLVKGGIGGRTSGAKYAKVLRMLPKIDPIMVLGLVAGAFTTAAFVPQVIRTWRSNRRTTSPSP